MLTTWLTTRSNLIIAMSESGRLSNAGDDLVGQENYVSRPIRDSDPFSDSSSSLGDLAAAPLQAFPLMKLSPELRLDIYDQVLIDLTTNRQRTVAGLNKYHRVREWPKNDFSAYLSLLLTCKEIHAHVKGLWENVYIHKCCFYFWKIPDFYRIATSLVKLGEPYRSARYTLRTRSDKEIGDEQADFITFEGSNFMKDQPGFPIDNPDYEDLQWSLPKFTYMSKSGLHTLQGEGPIPVETYQQGPRGRNFGRASIPGLKGCSIAVHDRQVLQSRPAATYVLMSGEVGNVFWGKYDAAFGHGKQVIWDEWERRGYPRDCLTRADIVLSHRALLELGIPVRWAGYRNKPYDLWDIELIYNLLGWLPGYRAYGIDY